jgi:peptide-N4-(N-acetyl-beta-glucosaminyl)asparagine amidase
MIAQEIQPGPPQKMNQEDFISELTQRYIQQRRERQEAKLRHNAQQTSQADGISVDEALARAMQAATIQKGETDMRAKVVNQMDSCMQYEDEELLEKARSILPVEQLHFEARELSEKDGIDFFEAFLKRLLYFWKHDFFSWVNCLPCQTADCQGKTENKGMVQPTEEDLQYGARRVELHTCDTCHSEQRFPRYNNPGKLLETRRGRCGEWANCFTLASRALGFQSRLVHDSTDHVWTEVYLDSLKTWIHTDCCENAFSTPKVYEKGWGKKLQYLIAYTAYEAIDVSKRYTDNFEDLLTRRTDVSEEFLAKLLDEVTNQRLAVLGDEVKQLRLVSRRADVEQMEREYEAHRKAKEDELQGRQSGAEEWRRIRGELGEDTP